VTARVRLAAFHYGKFAAWTDSGGELQRSLTPDEMLDDVSLYWFTNTATPSSSRSYWEVWAQPLRRRGDLNPCGRVDLPGENYRAPCG
jgi:hypothetical protein